MIIGPGCIVYGSRLALILHYFILNFLLDSAQENHFFHIFKIRFIEGGIIVERFSRARDFKSY